MTNINPLGNMLLIKKIDVQEKKTTSGLVLTADAAEQILSRAEVVKVGPGERSQITGNINTIDNINVGSVVWYHENHATDVEDSEGNKFAFINANTLFGYEE